jgi:hypothetical protein
LNASQGIPDDSAVPTLRWSGVLSSTPMVTLTYAVSVTETGSRAISNTVSIDGGAAGMLSRSSMITANGQDVYLPLVSKGN